MSKIINVKLFLNNKFYCDYFFPNNFQLKNILTDFFEEKNKTNFLEIAIYSNIYYPHDRNRIDQVSSTFYNSYIGNKIFLEKKIKKIFSWKWGYKIFIRLIDENNIIKFFLHKNDNIYIKYVEKFNFMVIYNSKEFCKDKYELIKIENEEKNTINFKFNNDKIIIKNPLNKIYDLYFDHKVENLDEKKDEDEEQEQQNDVDKCNINSNYSIKGLIHRIKGYNLLSTNKN